MYPLSKKREKFIWGKALNREAAEKLAYFLLLFWLSKQSNHIIIYIFSFKSFRAVYCTVRKWSDFWEYTASALCNGVYMQSEIQATTRHKQETPAKSPSFLTVTNLTCPVRRQDVFY